MSAPEQRPPMFYGRRKGKPIRPGKQAAYDQLISEVSIALPESEALLDPHDFFGGRFQELWLEIGFGDGEQITYQAENNPGIGMIGCEPFLNGVSALCRNIQEKSLENVRIFENDARLLLPRLQPKSLDRCCLLNSDPWPKTRHHKRRFVQTETLDMLHRLLKPGAEFRMSTDHASLAVWVLEKTYFHKGFRWNAQSAGDWRSRPADMPITRYQKKGAGQGRPTVFLSFTTI